MGWQPRRNAWSKDRAHRRRAPGRFRLPFWAGWMALIAGATLFHLVMGPNLSPWTDPPGRYQCSRNVYNCGDFRTRAEAQAACQACGGRGNDVHRLDDDYDGLACELLPSISW